MSIFDFFRTKKSVDSPALEQASDESKSAKEEPTVYHISYCTGMPIDAIYAYIKKDFEEQGYNDALINGDIKYREAKEEIICNDLKMLFKRISLRYKSDIRELNVKISQATEQGASTSAGLLVARKETMEEHLAEIQNMEERLAAKDSSMFTMIESYKRGFFKGVTANAEQFLSNK